jgi:hypothetical protein
MVAAHAATSTTIRRRGPCQCAEQIGDKILDIGLTALFDGTKAGSGTGPLGGLFSFLFASGGYTGPGGKDEPAGIVHKGEYVFSKAAVDRIGAGNLDAMHRNLKGYADGRFVAPTLPRLAGRVSAGAMGVHVTVGVSADSNGNLMPFVESVTQRNIKAAAPKIVSAANAGVVPTMARYQTQKAGGDWRNGT